MKKKVFIVVPSLGTGGGEKLVIDLAANINKELFDVSIISLFPKKNTIYEKFVEKEKINIIYMNKRIGLDIKVILNLIKLFKDNTPDIVHTHLNVMPYVLPAVVTSKVKSRVHTVHSVADKEATGVLRFIMNCSYKLFKFTPVAICDYVKGTIEDIYKIEPENIPCIYNGINIRTFNRKDKIEQTMENKDINLINTGTLYHVKNQKLIIDALAEVHKEINNIKLTILGDGELRNELEEQVRRYKLNDKISFKGIVENVSDELNNSDIYIMASNYEGLPLSVLEAMACNLPIIATKAGGVVDIVKDYKNGLLIDIGNQKQLENAIKILCKDEKLRKKMSIESRSLSKQYDIKKIAKCYEDLYIYKLL